jgi:hypothetical protein
MGGYSWFPWLIIAALLVYLLLLVKIARARTIAKPIKDSKAWLITQTVFAWLFALLFGFKTFAILLGTAIWQQFQNPNRGNPPHSAPFMIGRWIGFSLTPLLFALGVRWTRSVMRKWKTLKVPPVEEISK